MMWATLKILQGTPTTTTARPGSTLASPGQPRLDSAYLTEIIEFSARILALARKLLLEPSKRPEGCSLENVP